MLHKTKPIPTRRLLMSLTVLLLAMLMSVNAAAIPEVNVITTSQSPTVKNTVSILTDGYYRIRNLATGQYLDTYDIRYDVQGSAYVDAASGQNGQDFCVTRNADGSYAIVPQSDGAQYALSYAAGSYVTKRAEWSATESFDIFTLSNGVYTIAPAYADDRSLVLGVSSAKTYHGFTRAALTAYTASAGQQWVFEPIAVTGISLAYTETRERLYSVGTFYAAMTPYPAAAGSMRWVSDNESVLMIDQDGSWCAIGVGVATVTVSCGGMSASCRVEVVDDSAFAYYSQHDIDGSYWNGGALSGIYFSAGVTKRYAIDRYNGNLDWMDEGCALTAMPSSSQFGRDDDRGV